MRISHQSPTCLGHCPLANLTHPGPSIADRLGVPWRATSESAPSGRKSRACTRAEALQRPHPTNPSRSGSGCTRRVTQPAPMTITSTMLGFISDMVARGCRQASYPRFIPGSQTLGNGYPVSRVAETTGEWSDRLVPTIRLVGKAEIFPRRFAVAQLVCAFITGTLH